MKSVLRTVLSLPFPFQSYFDFFCAWLDFIFKEFIPGWLLWICPSWIFVRLIIIPIPPPSSPCPVVWHLMSLVHSPFSHSPPSLDGSWGCRIAGAGIVGRSAAPGSYLEYTVSPSLFHLLSCLNIQASNSVLWFRSCGLPYFFSYSTLSWEITP